MLIDNTFFIAGRTEIAGINTQSGGKTTEQAERIQNSINSWVAEKEPMFLRAILGECLYSLLVEPDKQDSEHDICTSVKELRKAIRDVLIDETNRCSPIAMYVYFFYERNRITVTTIAGERQKKTDNSVSVSSMSKLVMLWNDMVDYNFRIIQKFEHMGIPVMPDFDNDIFQKINQFNI